MTKLTVFECNECGERQGYRNGLTDIPLVYKSAQWDKPRRENGHLCIDCGSVDINDVLEVWDEFLCDSPNGEVVALRKTYREDFKDKEKVVRVEDLTLEEHGNIAIIESAIDTVNENLLGGSE